MRDFEMIVRQMYGGHDITIVPISDVHLGAEECMDEAFRRFVRSVQETPNVYVTLGGDLIDNGLKSSVTNVYRASMRPFEQKREMSRLLEPIRDRIICAVSGNHERRSSSGKSGVDDDPTYDILCKLDLEDIFRENLAVVKLQLGSDRRADGSRSTGYQRPTYVLVVTHGAGGGMLPGAAVNRGQRFAYVFDGMDLLVLGHTHVPYNIKYSKVRIDPRNNCVSRSDFHVVCSTSWLDYSGYPVQKLLYPAAFADQTVRLCGKEKKIRIETE